MTRGATRSIRAHGRVVEVDGRLERRLEEAVRRVDPAVIVSEYAKITPRIVAAGANLKGIVVWGVGFDHVDVGSASAKGVYVVNTSGSNAESVAEHAFALIFSLSRHLPQFDGLVRSGLWTTREETGLPAKLLPQDLAGKTLGVVGLGSVGRRVAGMGKGFGMNVIAHDPYVGADSAKRLGVKLTNLPNLLKQSDIVTLHLALSKDTKGMIGPKQLSLMRRTALLVNTSRGAVVDEDALIKAIRSKKIAGAGLDVFEREPIAAENPLLSLDNVVLTPHCAGMSREAMDATSLAVSREAVRILRGELPVSLVNKVQLFRDR